MTLSVPPLDLEITVVSAKHLKNVNWRQGDLKPYCIFWLNHDHRLATKADESGSTRPVWNERFLIPFTCLPGDATLTLEVFHSKPLNSPKPVATLRFPIEDLVDQFDSGKIRTFELHRPSGRPQGKIRLKLAILERTGNDYTIGPQPNYYYSTAPPPRDYRGYSAAPSPSHPYTYGSYSDPYPNHYPIYSPNQPLPPPPGPPFIVRQSSFGGGPSAPVDYAQYDHKAKSGNLGLRAGLAVGALAGAVGGIALEEGSKYEGKIAERDERDMAVMTARDDYRNYLDQY